MWVKILDINSVDNEINMKNFEVVKWRLPFDG